MLQYCPRLSALISSATIRALFSPESLLPSTLPGSFIGTMRYVRLSSKPAYFETSKRNFAALCLRATSFFTMTSMPPCPFAKASSGLLVGMSKPSSNFHSWASSEPLFSPSSTLLPLRRNAFPLTAFIIRQLPESSETFQNCPASPSVKSAKPTAFPSFSVTTLPFLPAA